MRQYHLINAEKELLQKTLRGTIKVLMDILSLSDPDSFGRTVQMRDTVRFIARELEAGNAWEIELAWMLSHLGYITIPPSIAMKIRSGRPLTKEESEIEANALLVSRDLLTNIPRLEGITNHIKYMTKHFDGSGLPIDHIKGPDIPIGGRILKVVSDLASMQAEGMTASEALNKMMKREGWYDPHVLEITASAFETSLQDEEKKVALLDVNAKDLRVDDVLLDDVLTVEGILLVSMGSVLTELHLEWLKNFYRLIGVIEPIKVERRENAEHLVSR